MTKLKEDIHFFRALQTSTRTFISSNYCTNKNNPYGFKNIQLESYLTRSDYSLLPNRTVSSHSASYKSVQLDTLVMQFLNRMTELQKRVLQNCPAKFRKKQRVVFGLNQICRKYLPLRRIKTLVVATNLEEPVVHSQDYREMMRQATEQQIPVVWACSRGQLGNLMSSRISISAIGVIYDESTVDLHQNILNISNQLQNEWLRDILQFEKNPYSESSESLLWIASYNGHLKLLRVAYEKYPEMVELRDDRNGMLPIHVCCLEGHFNCFSYLIQKNPGHLFERTFQLKDCAYLAVENNSILIVKAILNEWKISDINVMQSITSKYTSGLSLIDLCIVNESNLLFDELLESTDKFKAYFSLQGKSIEDFLLHLMSEASFSKNIPIWKRLLKFTLDFDVSFFLRPCSPIIECVKKENIEILRLILSYVRKRLQNHEFIDFLLKLKIDNKSIFDYTTGTLLEKEFSKFQIM